MAVLEILEFPDPRLRTRAQPVTEVNARVRTLVDDMFDTMYAAPGIGRQGGAGKTEGDTPGKDEARHRGRPLCQKLFVLF